MTELLLLYLFGEPYPDKSFNLTAESPIPYTQSHLPGFQPARYPQPLFDIGDIVGIRGLVFRTKTGEISVHAEEITLLSKSLQILPEKFHGLTNTDVRYQLGQLFTPHLEKLLYILLLDSSALLFSHNLPSGLRNMW